MKPLKRFHTDAVHESRRYRHSLQFWRKHTTREIVESLKPGGPESLKVKADGTVMQGNTRIKVLQERGYDVDMLPCISYP